MLLTTQYLEEADHLADQIMIIDRGRVVAQGTPTALKARVGRDVIEIRAREDSDLPTIARVIEPLGADRPAIEPATQRLAMRVDDGTSALLKVIRILDEVGLGITDIALRRPTLDEVFLALTGEHDGRGRIHTSERSEPGSRPGACGVTEGREPWPP